MESDHNCEIPGWRCYGNAPIVLEIVGDYILWKTEVNHCPFCGTCETLGHFIDRITSNDG
jgi:hypothetical protein